MTRLPDLNQISPCSLKMKGHHIISHNILTLMYKKLTMNLALQLYAVLLLLPVLIILIYCNLYKLCAKFVFNVSTRHKEANRPENVALMSDILLPGSLLLSRTC